MNIGVIFAGGSGKRMHTKDKPKQFLMVHGKPIICHTIDIFERHPDIDGIIVVCIKDWIPYMEEMQYRYRFDKVKKIVPGGTTGQLSIYNGLAAAKEVFGETAADGSNHIVLIHDGVRPLIDSKTISDNIAGVKAHGSAITSAPAKETVVLINDDSSIDEVVERDRSLIAKAPQSFYLKDILAAQNRAISEGNTDMIDSCTLMRHYGAKLFAVEGSYENIKITTPEDFYTFRAIYDARENQQLNF
jgi:2-C-methyl-D-erythritol 4-phosphate cytidylyltransferase